VLEGYLSPSTLEWIRHCAAELFCEDNQRSTASSMTDNMELQLRGYVVYMYVGRSVAEPIDLYKFQYV